MSDIDTGAAVSLILYCVVLSCVSSHVHVALNRIVVVVARMQIGLNELNWLDLNGMKNSNVLSFFIQRNAYNSFNAFCNAMTAFLSRAYSIALGGTSRAGRQLAIPSSIAGSQFTNCNLSIDLICTSST